MYEIFIHWWYNDNIKIYKNIYFVRKLDEDWKISRLLPSRVCIPKLGNYPILWRLTWARTSRKISYSMANDASIRHQSHNLFCYIVMIDDQFLSHYLLCFIYISILKMMIALIFLFYVYSSIIVSLSIFVLGA